MSVPEITALTATTTEAVLAYTGIEAGDEVAVQVRVNGGAWSEPAVTLLPLPSGPPALAVATSRTLLAGCYSMATSAGARSRASARVKSLVVAGDRKVMMATRSDRRKKAFLVWRGSEAPVVTELPDVPFKPDGMENLAMVATDAATLWTWSIAVRAAYSYDPPSGTWKFMPGQGGALRQWRLDESGAVTLVNTWMLGDEYVVSSDLIALADGAVLAVGYRLTDQWPSPYPFPCHLRAWRWDGTTMTEGPTGILVDNLPGNTGQTAMVAAQHPVDGRVWVFAKGDSYHRLNAIQLHPVTLAPIYADLDWVPALPTTPAKPEGEFPELVAAPDPIRGRILLAYQQDHNQIIYIGTKWVKGAWVAMTSVRADGSYTTQVLEALVERISGFAVSIIPSGALLVARYPLTATPPYFLDLAVWRELAGIWSGPLPVGRTVSEQDDPQFLGWTLCFPTGAPALPSMLEVTVRA